MLSHTLRLIILLGLCVASAMADQLPRASAAESGFSSDRLAALDQHYWNKVNRGEIAGIVLLVARHGKIVHFSAIGYADLQQKRKLELDSIFRLYSMTKPVVSVALMMLYEEGRFQMHDPVAKFIPELANLRVLRTPNSTLDDTVPLDQPPTIEDLMRHTAGITHGLLDNPLDREYIKRGLFGLDVSLEEMVSKLAKLPVAHQPGTAFSYGIGPDVQARLVEVLSGMPFDVFLEKRIFHPLGMKDTGFWLAPEKASRLATVHWRKDGHLLPLDDAHGYPTGIVLSEPWSVNSYTENHKRKGGSYGLAGTAEDYWRFAQMMANGGKLDGTRLLSPQTVKFMLRDHTQKFSVLDASLRGIGWGLGFPVMKDSVAAGIIGNEGAFFGGGYANTHFWADPTQSLVIVAMSQHMGTTGVDLMGTVETLVYSALTE